MCILFNEKPQLGILNLINKTHFITEAHFCHYAYKILHVPTT
jgi:hypothetical protein